jgi:two-component system chemotaxis response regulator CheB
MIRVLVVEDSATARTLLVEILRSDPEIEVVGEARDGVEGVALTHKLQPNVITMDVRMPRMDGFEATKEIMITAPTPIVIVSASTRSNDVKCAVQALRAGALTVLAKPQAKDSSAFEKEAQELITTVKAMSQVKVVRHWRPTQRPEAPPAPPAFPRPGAQPQVVAVATSTGGPAALQTVLGALPSDFPVPILVVQHITSGFTAGLAAWLDTVCSVKVKLAEQGERVAPHTVYLAPDDRHLGVARLPGTVGPRSAPRASFSIAFSEAPPIGGFRPSGTYLFESVARSFGAAAVAVILTGMGEDGVEGLRHIRQAGGRIIAQDERSSVVFGMPAVAIAAGLADEVLSLEQMPARLGELV